MAKVLNYQVLVAGHAGPVSIKADSVKYLQSDSGIGLGDWQFLTDGVEVARFNRQSVTGYWLD